MSNVEQLTVRQKFIMNNLVEKGPLTLKGLSQQIDVSERTILREISALNDWLKQHKVRISESGGMLHIDGVERDLAKARESLKEIPHLWMLNQEQRQVLITAQLLLAEEPIKSAYFSHQFNVVEGTIGFYLDKINHWLQEKNLTMVRKRGYGLEIKGTDWQKRNAFVDLIYSYKPLSELLTFLYEDNQDYLLMAFFKVTFGETLTSLTKRLIEEIHDNIFLKNDIGYFSAFMHLLLVLKRTESGEAIEMPAQLVQEILSSEEYNFMSGVQAILSTHQIKLPDAELAYLALHLSGGKNLFQDENEAKRLGFELEDLIREVIYLTGKKLNLKIFCDEVLLSGLIQHINPALYRLTMGLEVRNPIINEIRHYYKHLYDAVAYACRHVFSKYNLSIPDNEVGYITMHIGAALERQQRQEKKLSLLIICPNGISTAKMLFRKIRNEFPDLETIETCSLRDMHDKIKNDYAMVVSTVKLEHIHEPALTVISPFLLKEDIDKIKTMILKFRKNSLLEKNPGPMPISEPDESQQDFDLANTMLEKFQLKNLSARTYLETIQGIVDEIHALDLISDKKSIQHLIAKREEKGNVIIPGRHIALIHFRAEEVPAPFVGVFRLPEYIQTKGVGYLPERVDTFFVMLARKNESNYILELLGKISVALVEDDTLAEALRFGELQDIRNELVEILNREEEQ
ncbi:Mannitol operon activator, BglG family [Desulfosporosinus sp. I2]|uniref:BglG family transcription antiterminator n=1 Tax=Desulfosporosinus sp. I2 TaxID=1617025 RepID=UPI0005F076C1|nr:BglG family transcription antiterminator [Desulfosporosinus sp. I2]KJR44957.1 Mannitol operon activator, BglG family [Desulfosporosinus sp. I2]